MTLKATAHGGWFPGYADASYVQDAEQVGVVDVVISGSPSGQPRIYRIVSDDWSKPQLLASTRRP